MRSILIAILFSCVTSLPLTAQNQVDKCFVLCQPEIKIEPTFTWENLIRRPKIAKTDGDGNTVTEVAERERVFETVIAVEVPTTIPRVSFVLETIFKPFVKGNSPELETELNFHWLRSENTKGWVGSHFDI